MAPLYWIYLTFMRYLHLKIGQLHSRDWMVLYGLYGKIEDNPRHYTVLQSLAELHWTEEAFASGRSTQDTDCAV